MLRPRLIPCLLIHNNGLVKTTKFKDPKYVGDPLNAVKIFNEKYADELMVVDIDATRQRRGPDYARIEKLALECRMPLCYGGGVKTVEQASKIFSLGVEKVAISSAAIENLDLVTDIAKVAGSQSVVVVVDVKRSFLGGYDTYTHNATKKAKLNVYDYIESLQQHGVGEIVVNFIDKDGTMKGYDFDFIDKIKPKITVPLTILGGAGSKVDIEQAAKRYKCIGIAAGSLFVFKGKYRAVLINYPNPLEKSELLQGEAQFV